VGCPPRSRAPSLARSASPGRLAGNRQLATDNCSWKVFKNALRCAHPHPDLSRNQKCNALFVAAPARATKNATHYSLQDPLQLWNPDRMCSPGRAKAGGRRCLDSRPTDTFFCSSTQTLLAAIYWLLSTFDCGNGLVWPGVPSIHLRRASAMGAEGPHFHGHRQRLRDRFQKSGFVGFQDVSEPCRHSPA
jgi:hypothetical protein